MNDLGWYNCDKYKEYDYTKNNDNNLDRERFSVLEGKTAHMFIGDYNFKEFAVEIKNAAFKHGVDISTVTRVGGIYFRDMALKESGFTPDDLDKLDVKKEK